MNRTEFIKLAKSIVDKPESFYPDVSDRAVIYEGTYRGVPVKVYVRNKLIICVCYNGVCYHVNRTYGRTAQCVRNFRNDYQCKTIVFLYPRSGALFVDEQGSFSDPTDKDLSKKQYNYADVIPIPAMSD